MNDPQRFIEHSLDRDPVFRDLVESATCDDPSPADRHAVASALGIVLGGAASMDPAATTSRGAGSFATSSVTPVGTSTATTTKLATSLFFKLAGGAVLAFAVGVATGMTIERTRDDRRSAASAAVPSAAQSPTARTDEGRGEGPDTDRSRSLLAERAAPGPATDLALKASRQRANAASQAASPPPPANTADTPTLSVELLAHETKLLDRAKAAIARRAFRDAAAALDAYAALAPAGVLMQEAHALRVQLFAEEGHRLAAVEHARAFLAQFPTSPYAKRVRATLSSLEESRTDGEDTPNP